MDQMDFEWVERPPSGNAEHIIIHDDDTDSFGVISLEDSASEGCGTPSAAAAVITALEDAGPFDQLQDMISEAMASIHCMAPSPAALQQQQHKVEESEATCDSPMASALQQPSFSTAQASSSVDSAAAAHEIPADSSAVARSSNDNPNPSDKPTARSASTRTSLLLLLRACAAAAIAALVLLMLRPAAFTSSKTATATFAAKEALPVATQYGRYTATRVAVPMPLNYTRATAATTATRTVSNTPAGTPQKATAAAAAAGKPRALLQPVPAPVNMMLSCPKEWQCRYPKPQLAPWLTGTAKTSTASPMLVAPAAVTGSACQAAAAAAAAAGAQCPGKAANMSAAHRLCTYLWTYHASKPTAAATVAAAAATAAPLQPAVQCTVTQQLQQEQPVRPAGQQPQPASNSTRTDRRHSSKLVWLQAAAGLLAAAADQAAKAANAAVGNSTQWWTNLTTNARAPAPVAAVVSTPVWRIMRPTKPVPALYLPAPPCLALVKPGASGKQQLLSRSSGQARSGSATTLYRTAATTASSTSSSRALDFAAIKKLVYKAAGSFGNGLTLPMLPPTAYPQPGRVSSNSSSSSTGKPRISDSTKHSANPSSTGAAQMTNQQPGLTLPMLPPVDGHNAVTGGLTLPMLPPVSCLSCGSSLQLLPSPSSSRIAAVAAAQPTLLPADQQPACPLSSPRTCTAAQQQYKHQQHYKLQYNQRFMLPQQQPKEKQRGTSAASCKSSSGRVLLVHMPPAVTAAASHQQLSSGSSNAAGLAKQHLGCFPDRRSADAALLTSPTSSSSSAAAVPADTKKSTDSRSANVSAARHTGATIKSNTNSTSSSASAGAFASGSWVATWVSFPMLLPTEHDAAVSSCSKQQQQQQRDGAAELSNPWGVKSAFNQVSLAKQRAAASSTTKTKTSIQAAFKKTLPFSRAAAPAPYRPRSFKARPVTKPGHKSSAAAANRAAAAPAAAAASAMRSWAAQLNTMAAALLQPAQSVMQIVSTARSRSLQCVIPPAADVNSGGVPAGKHKNSTNGGSGGGGFGSSAFAANSAAFFASRELFAAALALDKASWHAAHAAAAPAAAKQQQKLQSLCASVGYAHRELQAKLAAAVFKQQDAAQTNSAAALFSSATTTASATAKASRYPAKYGKKAAAAAGSAGAAYAIPLGPLGGVELRSAAKPHGQASATASHSLLKSIAASGAVQGPLLPLKQQLTAYARATEAPVFAPARVTGVAKRHAHAGSSGSSSSSGSSVWMLNFGWDQRSAWAAAKAAAQLAKAEANLQAACQHLLGQTTAAAKYGLSCNLAVLCIAVPLHCACSGDCHVLLQAA